ncbi:Transcription factor spt8, partial [Cladochytrium tenue]
MDDVRSGLDDDDPDSAGLAVDDELRDASAAVAEEHSADYLNLAPQKFADSCSTYDIVPHVSAVHPCSVYALDVTKNMRWIFTGGDDGFIRKFEFVPSINGDQALTLTQRHGLVDSIQRAGALSSAWELEEIPAP